MVGPRRSRGPVSASLGRQNRSRKPHDHEPAISEGDAAEPFLSARVTPDPICPVGRGRKPGRIANGYKQAIGKDLAMKLGGTGGTSRAGMERLAGADRSNSHEENHDSCGN